MQASLIYCEIEIFPPNSCVIIMHFSTLQVVGLRQATHQNPDKFLEGLPPVAMAIAKLTCELLSGQKLFSLTYFAEVLLFLVTFPYSHEDIYNLPTVQNRADLEARHRLVQQSGIVHLQTYLSLRHVILCASHLVAASLNGANSYILSESKRLDACRPSILSLRNPRLEVLKNQTRPK